MENEDSSLSKQREGRERKSADGGGDRLIVGTFHVASRDVGTVPDSVCECSAWPLIDALSLWHSLTPSQSFLSCVVFVLISSQHKHYTGNKQREGRERKSADGDGDRLIVETFHIASREVETQTHSVGECCVTMH